MLRCLIAVVAFPLISTQDCAAAARSGPHLIGRKPELKILLRSPTVAESFFGPISPAEAQCRPLACVAAAAASFEWEIECFGDT